MNENEEDIVIEDVVPEADENDNDTTDWKAEYEKSQGIAKRFKTKFEKLKELKEEKKEVKEDKKGSLDRLDKAILRVEKINDSEEIKLVEDMMKESGKTLEQVLESKFFKSELKEMREVKAVKEATPTGTKRSGQSPRDEVDYWIAKGELPDDNPELARKVVNAKLHKIKSVNQFTDEPVA